MSTRLDAYRSRPAVLPPTVHRDDVGAAAWFALLRDGVVRRVWGDLAIAADLQDTPELRAVALAPLVPARGVVGRRTAAWIHTGRFPPVRVDVLVPTGGRRTDPHPERASAEATLGPYDVVHLGALRATTVQRTGTDLARTLPPQESLPVLRALRGVGFDPQSALVQLAQLRGQRGVRLARAALLDL